MTQQTDRLNSALAGRAFDTRSYRKGSQSSRNYDISRDGKHFVFVKRQTGGGMPEPIVVLNWIEEVKRLMAAAGIK